LNSDARAKPQKLPHPPILLLGEPKPRCMWRVLRHRNQTTARPSRMNLKSAEESFSGSDSICQTLGRRCASAPRSSFRFSDYSRRVARGANLELRTPDERASRKVRKAFARLRGFPISLNAYRAHPSDLVEGTHQHGCSPWSWFSLSKVCDHPNLPSTWN
jgi:hypothetical protein